ncbi:MAG: hypothetical protein V4792_08205 [Pseudomonadota bacterium]
MSHSYEDTFPASPPAAEPGGLSGDRRESSADPDVLARVVQGAHQTVDRLAQTAAPQVQRLQESVASARELGGEVCENVRQTVRENPLMALAGALAVGMLIGRRSR